MRASEFIPEINFNLHTHKQDVSRYDFDDYIGNTKPTGKEIGGYEIHQPVNYPYKAFLIKSKDDEGFLGVLQLTKFNGMWKSEVMFAPEIQGKGFAIPLYRYAIVDQKLTIVSDRSQSPGGAAIWEKLAQQPDINVYVYDTGDKKFHGKYDPRDSGRVYGVEDWRHKIRLVATTNTITTNDLDENFRDGKNQQLVRAYHGNQGGIDVEDLATPMWFTTSREDAEYYAGDDGYVVVVDLDIKNPYMIQVGINNPHSALDRWKELQAQGYDGIYDPRLGDWIPFSKEQIRVIGVNSMLDENFADGKVKGKSRPGRVKKAGASCKGSVTDLRAKAKKYGGEKGKMYHWCANMKAGKQK